MQTLSPAWRASAIAIAVALVSCARESGPELEAPANPLALGPANVLDSPAGAASAHAHLAALPGGGVMLSWLEIDGEQHVLKHAELLDGAWSAAREVARGDDWVVSAADLPAVVPLSSSLWAAHWRLPGGGSPYAYDIAVSVSADRGNTWSAAERLNDDGTPTEHGFVSLFPWGDDVGAVWLDGRELAGEFDTPESAAAAATTLRYARVGKDARSLEQGIVDDFVCDCCTTDIARGAGGELLVYRDRTPDEIRDIQVRRRTSEGWSEPVTLGPDRWEIEGCPVNGPAIDTLSSAAAAAWFTAPANAPKVRVAFSADGGATFGAPIDVDAAGSLGQVGVALTAEDVAVVSWWRRAAAGGAELALRMVRRSGELGPILAAGTVSSSRPDVVPQLIRNGDALILAWNKPGEVSGVRLLAIELGKGL
jgi:hypothetical protein